MTRGGASRGGAERDAGEGLLTGTSVRGWGLQRRTEAKAGAREKRNTPALYCGIFSHASGEKMPHTPIFGAFAGPEAQCEGILNSRSLK